MGSLPEHLHFVLFPFMAQGHMIPMVDIARLLSQRGVAVTIVTTPGNAARSEKVLARARKSGLTINLLQVDLPLKEQGLPEGCDNLDMLPNLDQSFKFFRAANMVEEQVNELLEQVTPRPSCLVSDMCLFYTRKVAAKFQIPRIQFHGYCCFCLVCIHYSKVNKTLEGIKSDSEHFNIPGLPEEIKFKRLQLPVATVDVDRNWKEIVDGMGEAEEASYGVLVNTFEELEEDYIRLYRSAKHGKVWFIGPVSLSHRNKEEKAERGNEAAIDEQMCLKWLEDQKPGSVIYACLGSLCNLTYEQLVQLGLGLEASNRPFIWALRGSYGSKEFEKWVSEDGFEERTRGRGLLIRGWVPQLLILSHSAVGVFLTHCGWNSTIEGISSGLPLITWPLFADQFCNEKLVQVIRAGVSVGVEEPNRWGEEERVGVLVKKEDVKDAVDKVLGGGKEAEELRERAKKFGDLANKAVEVGGSSWHNITLFIHDIMQNFGNKW